MKQANECYPNSKKLLELEKNLNLDLAAMKMTGHVMKIGEKIEKANVFYDLDSKSFLLTSRYQLQLIISSL